MQAKQIDRLSPKIHDDGFGAFIEAIKSGNVLLMIGRGYETKANHPGFNGDFYDYVLQRLNDESGTSCLDFSDLSHDNRFLLDTRNPNHVRNVHEEIVRIIDESEYSAEEDVSDGLLALLRTNLFPFVFTTSFSPLVEVAMRKQFGSVRIMNIYDKSNRDILSKEDFKTPTIYYLFGKAEAPRENEASKKFVATDNDSLEVLKKWQLDMGNSALLRYTPDKYILTLGCTQDDWLFRFIWYTLKGDRGKLSKGVIAKYASSESLSRYLKLNNILINNDADSLIKRIMGALSVTDESRWRMPQKGCDVFISYSRVDGSVAEALYESLTSRGLSVWYDKMNLGGMHGGEFMKLIKEAIHTSKFFVSILTNSIAAQAQEEHIYRREWQWAKEYKYGLAADCRCFAVVSDDYDIYERRYVDSLDWLAETDNFIFSSNTPDFSAWADSLQQTINELRTNEHRR